jgi:CubicO group peptidase (beta-lactamase class C family)
MLRAGGYPWQPGQRAAYSNLPYVLISLVLENITGLSYAEAISEYISKPLGSKATGFNPPRLENAIIPVGNGSDIISTSIRVYNA